VLALDEEAPDRRTAIAWQTIGESSPSAMGCRVPVHFEARDGLRPGSNRPLARSRLERANRVGAAPRCDRQTSSGSQAAAAEAPLARFLALIAVHIPALEVAARRLSREPVAAADLVQDTLERAWRRLDTLQGDEHARGWLLRVMRNTWIDQVRRRRWEVPLDGACEPPAATIDEPSWWEQVTPPDLREAIGQLREPYRSVAVLHDLDGHGYREIARLLEIPKATAATRLHRAHRQLRVLLQRQLAARE
jgi:RNA polymerase sigma-70 factor (ECF subfamily)